jgi:hypothetical protein
MGVGVGARAAALVQGCVLGGLGQGGGRTARRLKPRLVDFAHAPTAGLQPCLWLPLQRMVGGCERVPPAHGVLTWAERWAFMPSKMACP